jgi:hypothetical protein
MHILSIFFILKEYNLIFFYFWPEEFHENLIKIIDLVISTKYKINIKIYFFELIKNGLENYWNRCYC